MISISIEIILSYNRIKIKNISFNVFLLYKTYLKATVPLFLTNILTILTKPIL